MKVSNIKTSIVEHGGDERKATYLLLPLKVRLLFDIESGKAWIDVEKVAGDVRITIRGD
jgi:hypothetical protein